MSSKPPPLFLASLTPRNLKSDHANATASYGSLARFESTPRLRVFNELAVVGFGGDVSDMQHIDRTLTSLSTSESYATDPALTHLTAANLHTYLSKLMYKRRSRMNPLWNQILVAGLDSSSPPPPSPEQSAPSEHSAKAKPFLASVDLLGTTFSSPTLATGFGAHLAQPLLRQFCADDEADVSRVTREQAVAAVKECMKVLFYRDARSSDTYSIAVVEAGKGVELKEHEKLEGQSWAFAEGIRGYGTQTN